MFWKTRIRRNYEHWRKAALEAVREGRTAECCECTDPIIPGDFIAVGEDEEGQEVLVHAGFHFSLTSMSAFCETGAIGCAIWDGEKVVHVRESLAAKALRTGEPQAG